MSKQERALILGGILKRIGNFSAKYFEKSFDARLIFQKTIYLLQAFGLYLGYKFSWYIRGPYSPTLTRKGYELARKFEETPDVRFTKEPSEKRFNEFLEFLGEKKYDPTWLETIASIHFLKHMYPKRTEKKIMEMVLQKQPYLTIEECKEAWHHLEEFDLIS